MTLSTTTCRASFNGTGTTGPFSFSFPFNDDTEIVAFTITDNVVTDLLSSQYTLTGAGESTGGTLTTTSAVASGTTLVVMRTLPLTQTTDLENTGAFYGETHEDTFDRITMQIQQLKEEINRCLRMPKGVSTDQELSASRAGCYPYFDDDGVLTYVTATAISGTAGTATNADTLDGSDSTAFATAAQGAKADAALPSASYTAADVLTKIKTVDGSGSGLDADTVRGADPVSVAAPPGAIMAFARYTAPTGWMECNGQECQRTAYATLFATLVTDVGFMSQTFTVTIASPAVFTKASHSFSGGERLRLSTTGALPTGLDTTSDFFVERIDDNTFYLHTTQFYVGSSTRVITSGTQSGTHSYMQSLWGLGNGTTSFLLPDLRGEFLRGWDHGKGVDSGRGTCTWQNDAFESHTHVLSCDTGDAGTTGRPLIGNGAPYTDKTDVIAVTGGTETRPRNLAVMYCIKY